MREEKTSPLGANDQVNPVADICPTTPETLARNSGSTHCSAIFTAGTTVVLGHFGDNGLNTTLQSDSLWRVVSDDGVMCKVSHPYNDGLQLEMTMPRSWFYDPMVRLQESIDKQNSRYSTAM